MNANLPPKALVIETWLHEAAQQLTAASIASARLDAEIILAHTLRKPRTYLHAHPELELDPRTQEIANARLSLRLDRVPIAYIIGHKEFYGRRYIVTNATLVPRPESETMIDLLKQLIPADVTKRLVDVGTGTGVLGISAKLERPRLEVTLADISKHALAVATKNAEAFQADVALIQSDLLDGYPLTADIILANLPYVDPAWERSEETQYEPALALFADDAGRGLIKKLIRQTQTRLAPGGYLFLEADISQHATLVTYGTTHHLHVLAEQGFIIVLQKE